MFVYNQKFAILSLLSLLSLTSTTFAMEEPELLSASSSIKPKNAREELAEGMGLESYPTATSNLGEAFSCAFELFSSSVQNIEFLDGLLKEVKGETTIPAKMKKYQMYFGRIMTAPGKEGSDYIEELEKLHAKLKTGLNKYRMMFQLNNELYKTHSERTDHWTCEVDRFIGGFDEWISSSWGFDGCLKNAENQIVHRRRPRQSNRSLQYVDIFRDEDHAIGMLQDQKDLWTKVRELFLPYSSHPPEQLVTKHKSDVELQDEKAKIKKKADRNKKRRERAKRKKAELRQQQELTGKASLEEKENKSIECERAKETMVAVNKITTPVTTPSPPRSQPNETESKNSSKVDVEGVASTLTTETPENPKAVRKKQPVKKEPSKFEALTVSKKNLKVLQEIFTDPISRDISIDDFDNMIRSEAGFRGRVYGSRRSQLYEVYIEAHGGKFSEFLSLQEYKKRKKIGKDVEKHHFTLHRPHMRGKNAKGQTRFMYPALVELARLHLSRFGLTPQNIESY